MSCREKPSDAMSGRREKPSDAISLRRDRPMGGWGR